MLWQTTQGPVALGFGLSLTCDCEGMVSNSVAMISSSEWKSAGACTRLVMSPWLQRVANKFRNTDTDLHIQSTCLRHKPYTNIVGFVIVSDTHAVAITLYEGGSCN